MSSKKPYEAISSILVFNGYPQLSFLTMPLLILIPLAGLIYCISIYNKKQKEQP